MRQALIAGAFVIGGILLVMAMLLFLQPVEFPTNDKLVKKEATANTSGAADELLETEEIEHFMYLDSCGKYVMTDFVEAADLFEENKEDLRPRASTVIYEAGKKLTSVLKQLEDEGRLDDFTLVLEGNLTNEWTEDFERNNTWAYRLSYERALIVYKAWLKEEIDLRNYDIELVISGGGYYGLCPTKNREAKRFSVQLIPSN